MRRSYFNYNAIIMGSFSFKSLANSFFAILLMLGCHAVAQEKPIRIGVDTHYPPFIFKENDTLKGFDIELANALCESAKVECEIVSIDFDKLFDALLKEERIDAILASVSITPEREAKMAFSNAYYKPYARFAKLTSNAIPFQPSALENKRIGVEANTSYETYLKKNFNDIVSITTFETLEEAIDALQNQQIDAIIADELALELQYVQKKDSTISFWGPNLNLSAIAEGGAGMAFRKSDSQLVDLFNDALKDVKRSGKFGQISKRFFKRDISR